MHCLLIFATPDTISVAQMAKLVDALCSGRSACKGVLVRIQFWAHMKVVSLWLTTYFVS